MSGAPSAEYIAARAALLDALEALGPHRAAAVLIGAQAIYLHTGDAGLTAPEYTTDGDLALDPKLVPTDPDLAVAMRSKDFYLNDRGSGRDIGIWSSRRVISGAPAVVKVDLLMPDAVAGAGRRSARVGNHEAGAVRRVRGIEGCLVDRTPHIIRSFEESDNRAFEIMVAGPASLLVSKLIKLIERSADAASGGRDRLKDKDALDVLRLLRTVNPGVLAQQLAELAESNTSAEVTSEAIGGMHALFGTPSAPGSLMAAEAAFPEPPSGISVACATLTVALLSELRLLGLVAE